MSTGEGYRVTPLLPPSAPPLPCSGREGLRPHHDGRWNRALLPCYRPMGNKRATQADPGSQSLDCRGPLSAGPIWSRPLSASQLPKPAIGYRFMPTVTHALLTFMSLEIVGVNVFVLSNVAMVPEGDRDLLNPKLKGFMGGCGRTGWGFRYANLR